MLQITPFALTHSPPTPQPPGIISSKAILLGDPSPLLPLSHQERPEFPPIPTASETGTSPHQRLHTWALLLPPAWEILSQAAGCCA